VFPVPLDRVESFTLAGNISVIIHNKRLFFRAAIRHPPRSGNSITAVPDGYFNALPNLTDIDLSFNEGVCCQCHSQANKLIAVRGPGLLRLDEGVGFLQQLQKLRVQGAVTSLPPIRCVDILSGCPLLRDPPLEIAMLGPYTLHDYSSRVRASASTGILDLAGVPVKRLPAAALHTDVLHTLLLADSSIEVQSRRNTT
jgi:hypothetical protein